MLKRLLCLFRGHERGACVYRNEDLAVYECATCGTQYPVLSLSYHVHKLVEEEHNETVERVVGQWLS
jgi:hypothetical protein